MKTNPRLALAMLLTMWGALEVWTSRSVAQGTLYLDNNVPGVVVTHVYRQPVFMGGYPAGNGPNDYPPGTQNYSGLPFVEGSGFTAQLFASPSVTNPSFEPGLPTTTFRTGDGAGFFNPVTVTFSNIPADAAVALVILAVWDNKGGTLPTWADFIAEGVGVGGISKSLVALNFGGGVNTTPYLVGLESFTMGEAVSISEPSTLSLLGLGVIGLLLAPVNVAHNLGFGG
jgi:hypothetical protein